MNAADKSNEAYWRAVAISKNNQRLLAEYEHAKIVHPVPERWIDDVKQTRKDQTWTSRIRRLLCDLLCRGKSF